MRKALRGRLTFSNVTALIALVAVLATGGAIAATKLSKNSVKSKQVKNNSLTSKDLKNNKGVKGDDVADGSLGGADIADGSVTSADLAPSEPFHLVGAAGEPAFGNGGEGDCIWSDASGASPPIAFNPPAFYKDPLGVVHLAGLVTQTDGPGGDATCDDVQDQIVFVLPAGYAPARDEYVIVDVTDSVAALIVGENGITIPGDSIPGGAVVIFGGGAGMLFDNVSFRAAGPGNGLTPARRRGGASDRPLEFEDLKQLLR